MQRRTILILLAVVVLVVVVFVVFPPSPVQHADCSFPIRVTGRLVASTDETPTANVFVMTAPSRSTGAARLAGGSYRDRIDEWITYEASEKAAGRGMPDPHSAPWSSGGALTREDGTFSIVQRVLWSYDKALWWQSRPSRPPPRHHVDVLVIELEGRDPVILDVPEGTWTEHPAEDGLWATWDLGVIEAPSAP